MHGGEKELSEIANYRDVRVFRQDYVYSNEQPMHDAVRVKTPWMKPDKGMEKLRNGHT